MKQLIRPILLVLIGANALSTSAQLPDSLSLDLRTSLDGQALEIYVKAHGVTYDHIVLAFVYGIQWPTSSTATLGSAETDCPAGIQFQTIIPSNTETGFNHVQFVSENQTPLNIACPVEVWTVDEWRLLTRIPIENLSGITQFQLSYNDFAITNNLIPYAELVDASMPIALDYCPMPFGCAKIIHIENNSVAVGGGSQYPVTVSGHVFPCSPAIAGGEVHVMNIQEGITDTLTLSANCAYSATYMVNNPSGVFVVNGSCGDGTSDMNSSQYTVNTLGETLVTVDLSCGPLPTDCEACFTMEQTAPFTAVFDPSCTTGDEPFLNYVWDLTGGAVQTEVLQQTFSGPGNYFICLNIQAGNGCWSGICEDIYVDNDGNVFIVNEGCEANFNVEQAVDGNGDPIPFELDITNLSTGDTPISYAWTFSDGSSSTEFEPSYTLPNAGEDVYDLCLNITAGNCISWYCDSLYVLADGMLTDPFYWDCEGIVNGPDVVGAPCDDGDVTTVGDTWNNNCNCEGTSVIEDCEGIPGGPALPGTPCDDGDPLTSDDLWTAGCDCEGTTAQGPYWVTVMGHISPCSPAIANGLVTITSVQGTSPSFTQTANINSNCYYTATFLMDDLTGWFQVTAGCGNGTSDNNTGQYSINMLGSDTITIDLDCSGTIPVDCNNVPNGPAQPGTPCDDNDPATTNDLWSVDCICEGTPITPGDCEAGYWVIQAYDSTNGQVEPIPFELWVWNLSEGDGNFQFVWDFGDGTSSTEAYPTHVYGGSGPYILCLSMVDGTGCTDTYCDTVSVDNDGLLGANGDVRNVLTLNVINPLTTGIENVQVFEELALWPNPAADLLTISLNSTITGNTTVSIFDLNGRIVRTLNSAFNKGTNTLTIPVAELANGMYSIRIENNGRSIAHRFVKNQ